MLTPHRRAFGETVGIVLEMAGSPAVAAAWGDESSCAGMTVGGLTTRLMEMVVHSDDLGSSVGIPTPEFPEEATTPVFALLAGVAARRHGQAAVVRALSRPQRSPASISAF